MAGDQLFTGPSVVEASEAYEEAARKMAAAFVEGQLLANDLDTLVDAVVAEKVPKALALDVEQHSMRSEIVTNPASQGLYFDGLYMPSGRRPADEAIKISLYIPYTGTPQALTFRPSRHPYTNPPAARVIEREIVLSVTAHPDLDGQVIEKQLFKLEQVLAQWIEAINSDIAMLERRLRATVLGILAGRVQVLRQRDKMVSSLTIPVREMEAGRSLDIPVKPTTVMLEEAPGNGPAGERTYRLAAPIYERMIRTITMFGQALERRPASASFLLPDEETTRDWFMFMLSANYEAPNGSELFIGGEVENGKGKTDILVRYQNRNAFIGEFKFWHGPAKFKEAIEQLLSYTVWRDTKAAIILLITNKNATAAIDSAAECLASHLACKQTLASADPLQRRDYRFASPVDNRRIISLALLPVVVPKE
jgi:hypothetical protein